MRASGSLFAVSAALLLLELYWIRAFAESEWAHLASMVVSTALLGIGAGGVVVLVLGGTVERHGERVGPWLLGAFVCLAVLVPPALDRLPLEPMLLGWRLSAWGWVLVREAAVALPFAAGAAFVALRFRLAPARAAPLYAVNLAGSGAGVALALAWMTWRPTVELHVAAVVAGAVALTLEVPRRARALAVGAGAMAAVVAARTGAPALSETKDLAQALRLPGAEVLEERAGIPGRWTLLASPALHVAPGVSLSHPGPTPETRAIFVQGDLAEVVFASRDLAALRHRVFETPYVLRPPRSALVLGDGSVLEIQAATQTAAAPVVAIVPDSRTRKALAGDLGTFAGLPRHRLEVRGGSARAHLRRDPRRFDAVVLPAADSLGAAVAGLGATAESWLLTVEGIHGALDATTHEGILAVHRWTQAPPRDLPKLLATLVRALDVTEPRAHLALVQGWDAWVLCASRTPFSDDERERLAAFADAHGFDVWLPEAPRREPRHQLPGPPLAPLLERVLAGGTVSGTGPFVLEPATDDRPFFHHSLSYRRLGEWIALVREGTLVPSEWGDLFLGAGLLSALLLGAMLILVPGAAAAPRAVFTSPAETLLFAGLGFGYIGLEILFLHQGTRLFGTAGPSAALTLASFLLGSGTGAAILSRSRARDRFGAAAAFAACALAVVVALALPATIDRLSPAPSAIGGGAFVALAFLVAVPLGMPVPAGLAIAGRRIPESVPWLFGVNGWASVVGATAASLVAVVGGFALLGFATAGLYAMAGALLTAQASRGNR